MITLRWRHSSEFMPNVISYSRFGQVKVSFSNIMFTLIWLCPFLCPHFRVYVHILEYISTFQSICQHFQVNVHIFEKMFTIWNIYHFFWLLFDVYTLVHYNRKRIQCRFKTDVKDKLRKNVYSGDIKSCRLFMSVLNRRLFSSYHVDSL